MPLFVAPSQLNEFITKDLLEGPLKPIDYVDGDRVVRGYDASILVAVCGVWLRARAQGKLQKQQLTKAQKAEALTLALASRAANGLSPVPSLSVRELGNRCDPFPQAAPPQTALNL